MLDYLKQIEFEDLDISAEVEELGEKYLQEKIIPIKYSDDAYHIYEYASVPD